MHKHGLVEQQDMVSFCLRLWAKVTHAIPFCLLILCVTSTFAQQQDPRTINGGSILAMAGKNCVALAVDKRFGSGSQMVNIAPRHVWIPQPNLMVAFCGLDGDVQTLSQTLEAEVQAKLRRGLGLEILPYGGAKIEDDDVPTSLALSPKSMASLTSHVLYSKRGRLFTMPLVVGLDPQTRKPFLCGMDSIGAQSLSRSFVCAGAASKSLYGTAEAMWKPNLEPQELAEACGKAFQSALERDCFSGYGAIVYLLSKDGIIEYDLASRID
eukprot:Nitzschia sp. Nitz4//scaffold10_size219509//23010//23813//NITZ4_001398-RA/size219509-processed-gene-0.213-mRNA-1//1//CDS//3329532830//5528//frame0